MSRIQHILDKAEREGAVSRMRVVVETPSALASLGTAPVPAPAPSAPPTVETAPPVAPMRVVTDAQLDPRLVAARAPNGAIAEQYRALRTRILHGDSGSAVSVVLVTSPAPRDGKSLTVANLGLVMAQDFQRRVCIVDANLRHPQLHRLVGVPDTPGLSDVLAGRVPLDAAFIAIEEHHLTVLPAGTAPAHPAELLGTLTMRRVLDALRGRFDFVLIDAPAAVPLADVGILQHLVDSVILVVRASVTTKPAIHDTVALLDSNRLLGVVLNDRI
jgi:capsular exopolysaccharide synthesis family protein